MTFKRGDLVRPKALRGRYRVRSTNSDTGVLLIPDHGGCGRRTQHWRRPDEFVKILTLELRSN